MLTLHNNIESEHIPHEVYILRIKKKKNREKIALSDLGGEWTIMVVLVEDKTYSQKNITYTRSTKGIKTWMSGF